MNIIKGLTQGSSEWHKFRAEHLNASDAPAMLGVSSYKSRTELLTEKKTGLTPEIDPATQIRFNNGHKFETMARKIIENELNDELYPVVASAVIDNLNLGASLDGVDLMETFLFEHKTYGEKFKNINSIDELPKEYKVQMQQQLMVSGCSKCLFVASDGTKDNMLKLWFEYDNDLANEIISGWHQFAEDLKTFEPPKAESKPETVKKESLPTLFVQVKGEITDSNISDFKLKALSWIESINTSLVDDDSFAQAEEDIKSCKKAEEQLATAKAGVLQQTVTIDELFKTVDYLSEELRQKRLYLDKLVKSKKVEIKNEIIKKANDAITNHVLEINNKIKPVYLPNINPDFSGVIKGKRSILSIQDAVDTELASAKIKANELFMKISSNLNALNSMATDYKFLFNDLQNIAINEPEYFESLIRMRISEHKEAERAKEEARKAAEQARIEAEKKRIEAEAQQKLEADREQIRLEEERKARAEAEQKLREEQEKANQVSSKKPEVIDQKQSVSTVNSSLSKYEQLELKAAQWLRDMGVDSHVATNILAAIASGNSPFKLI